MNKLGFYSENCLYRNVSLFVKMGQVSDVHLDDYVVQNVCHRNCKQMAFHQYEYGCELGNCVSCEKSCYRMDIWKYLEPTVPHLSFQISEVACEQRTERKTNISFKDQQKSIASWRIPGNSTTPPFSVVCDKEKNYLRTEQKPHPCITLQEVIKTWCQTETGAQITGNLLQKAVKPPLTIIQIDKI